MILVLSLSFIVRVVTISHGPLPEKRQYFRILFLYCNNHCSKLTFTIMETVDWSFYLLKYTLSHCNRNPHHMVHWVLLAHTLHSTLQQGMAYIPHSSLPQTSYHRNHLDMVEE